jgi:hypothetical protein
VNPSLQQLPQAKQLHDVISPQGIIIVFVFVFVFIFIFI